VELFDLSVFKTFKLSERFNLRYSFQAINALNHPNFGTAAPSTTNLDNAGSSFFNYLENVAGNRVISMGLRLSF
jgi:hypothetical protein